MNVLGLDISMRATGVAVVDEEYNLVYSGVTGEPDRVHSDPEIDCIRRVRVQADLILDIVGRFDPSVLVIEGPAYNALVQVRGKGGSSHSVLPKSVCQLWQLTGAIKYAVMGEFDGEILIVSPTALKKHVTGDGKADKFGMMRAVLDRFGIGFSDHNECDAFGLCVFYLDGAKRSSKRRGK